MPQNELPEMNQDLLFELIAVAGTAAAVEERALTALTDRLRAEFSWALGDSVQGAALNYAIKTAEAGFWFGYETARDPRSAMIRR